MEITFSPAVIDIFELGQKLVGFFIVFQKLFKRLVFLAQDSPWREHLEGPVPE